MIFLHTSSIKQWNSTRDHLLCCFACCFSLSVFNLYTPNLQTSRDSAYEVGFFFYMLYIPVVKWSITIHTETLRNIVFT